MKQSKLKIETLYTHYRKGGNYTILHYAEMQINDEWIESLVYKSLDSGKIYVRSSEDFDNKFNIV